MLDKAFWHIRFTNSVHLWIKIEFLKEPQLLRCPNQASGDKDRRGRRGPALQDLRRPAPNRSMKLLYVILYKLYIYLYNSYTGIFVMICVREVLITQETTT